MKMKQLKLLYLFIGLLLFVKTNAQDDLPAKPSPARLVNDFIDMLTPDQEQALESKLVAYNQRTSNQIAIITTDDLKGRDVGDYAVELGKKWEVGNSNFNNGVVFVVYRNKDNTSRKIFIAVGKGMEGVLPDYTVSEIRDNDVTPYLKGNDFYRAFNNGTDAIIKAAEGKYVAPEGYNKKKSKSGFSKLLGIMVMIIIALAVFGGGRGGRGGGGSYMSRRGSAAWIIPALLSGGGGSSGGWSGGDSGGSSGGGDFGGFGGGDFGGGGAGGDW